MAAAKSHDSHSLPSLSPLRPMAPLPLKLIHSLNALSLPLRPAARGVPPLESTRTLTAKVPLSVAMADCHSPLVGVGFCLQSIR